MSACQDQQTNMGLFRELKTANWLFCILIAIHKLSKHANFGPRAILTYSKQNFKIHSIHGLKRNNISTSAG